MKKAIFRVVDEDRRRNVHGVDQAQAFLDTTLLDQLFNGAGDVDKAAAIRDFKPKMFG